jgi:uncharacterized protein YlxW (UPF0749 family)
LQAECAKRRNGSRGPVTIDGVVHFSHYDQCLLERAQFAVLNKVHEHKLVKKEQENVQLEVRDKLSRLQIQELELQREIIQENEKLEKIRAELQDLYKLKFESEKGRLGYDNETGRLNIDGVPVSAVS